MMYQESPARRVSGVTADTILRCLTTTGSYCSMAMQDEACLYDLFAFPPLGRLCNCIQLPSWLQRIITPEYVNQPYPSKKSYLFNQIQNILPERHSINLKHSSRGKIIVAKIDILMLLTMLTPHHLIRINQPFH